MERSPFQVVCAGSGCAFVTQIRGKYQWEIEECSGIDWTNAEEDILDDVWCAGVGGGFGVAVLVGGGGDDSIAGVLLVVGVPERLVWVRKEKPRLNPKRMADEQSRNG
jgi:hypothetical protein